MSQGMTNPKQALIERLRREYDRLTTTVSELKNLIGQSQLEVERLQQRNVAITAKLQRIEANFETVPRSDIKTTYNEAIDARTRLLTMRGELEKHQRHLKQTEEFGQFVAQLLEMVEGVSPAMLTTSAALPAGRAKQVGANGGLTAETINRLVEAQEAERKRLSRQLHDGPAQSLTNFILQAEICQRLFDRNPDRASEELNNLKAAASSSFQKVRDFIFDLRPMMLDDLGLVPTVRRYTEAFQSKSNIETNLHLLGEDRRLEPHREVMMFRSLQELLSMAREHTSPTKIDITLDITPDYIKAVVEDNGHSYDPQEILAGQSEAAKAMGLTGLRERLELVLGQVEVNSVEGQPNKVTVTIPLITVE